MSVILSILATINLVIFPFISISEQSTLYCSTTIIKSSSDQIRDEIFYSQNTCHYDPLVTDIIEIIETPEKHERLVDFKLKLNLDLQIN